MNEQLKRVQNQVYEKCDFQLEDLVREAESAEYEACRFHLDGKRIICRNAKITPRKIGQFVTFWKRMSGGPIQPFDLTDHIDFYVVNVLRETEFGQFIFPRSVLIQRGIISTAEKEGKRAFRVYPPWDVVESKQAERTQKWQSMFFLKVDDSVNVELAKRLYGH